MFHGRSPLSEICNDLTLAQQMPLGAVHTITAKRRHRSLSGQPHLAAIAEHDLAYPAVHDRSPERVTAIDNIGTLGQAAR
jgi:hypothetical protein